MGLISKIRDKSGLAIGLIAAGLGLFIVGGDLIGPNSNFFGKKQIVGSIDGDDITLQEFNEAYQILEGNFQRSSQRSPNEQESQSLRDEAWRQLVYERVYAKEYAKLGIGVSTAEANAMVRGDSMYIHPQMRNIPIFQDSTQKFSQERVKQFLSQISNDPVAAAEWVSFKNNLVKARLSKKYENLAINSSYVTKAEARREYEDQTNKYNLKYVFVPYSNIPDSTIKVTDEQLVAYMKKYPNRFKALETRSFEYVTFKVAPSKEDTAAFVKDLRELAKNFALAKNDSSFATSESEKQGDFSFRTVNTIPDGVFNEKKPLLKGGIYGPFLNNNMYAIVKVTDVQEDSTDYVRAAHILFKADKNNTEQEKADAKKRANEILDKIKNGEDFAKMAKIYGSDGTAQKGGDLGWFTRGVMVAPFNTACFNATEAGLLPALVETEFGYHIVSITNAKTRKKYKLAVIEKGIYPTEETTNEVYNKALEFQASIKSIEDYQKKVGENPALVSNKATKLGSAARNINDIKNAREIMRWAFNEETSVGDVSSTFDIGEQGMFIVAVLTGSSEKDAADLEFFRDEVTNEVMKEVKKEQILKKFAGIKGNTLEDIAKAYGENTSVQTANNVVLNSAVIGNAGYSPIGAGKASVLKKGEKTQPFADETGVMVVEMVEATPAAEIADYSQYRNQVADRMKSLARYFVTQAIEEIYEVNNDLSKFY